MACLVLIFLVAMVSSAVAAPMLVEAPLAQQPVPIYEYPMYEIKSRDDSATSKPNLFSIQTSMSLPSLRLPKVPAVPDMMRYLGLDRLATGVRGFLDNVAGPTIASGRVPPYTKISDLPGTSDPGSSYVCGSNAEKGVMVCVFPKKEDKDEEGASDVAKILPLVSGRRKEPTGAQQVVYNYPGMQPAYYIAN